MAMSVPIKPRYVIDENARCTDALLTVDEFKVLLEAAKDQTDIESVMERLKNPVRKYMEGAEYEAPAQGIDEELYTGDVSLPASEGVPE